MSGSISSSSSGMMEVDTKTLPRIGGVHKDAEIWKFRITDWFRREEKELPLVKPNSVTLLLLRKMIL